MALRADGARSTSSTRAVSSLFLLQVLTRASNFALGAILARTLGPEWFAIANVQLQLVSASALFLTKEGLRRACQRLYPGGEGTTLMQGVNLAWLSVPLTVLSASAVGFYSASTSMASSVAAPASRMAPLSLLQQQPPPQPQPVVAAHEYVHTVWLVCIASILEACAEPGCLYAQSNSLIPWRVMAEGVALMLKTATLAVLVLVYRDAAGAAAFGYAQLLYSFTYVAMLYGVLHRFCGMRALRPRLLDAATAATSSATSSPW